MQRAVTKIPGRLLAGAGGGLLVAGRAQAAFAELPSPTALSTATTQPSVAPSPAAASGPLITGIEGSTALWVLLSLVLIVIVAWMLPLLIDLLSAYGAQRKTRDQLQALIDAVAGTPRDGSHGPGPGGPGPRGSGPESGGGGVPAPRRSRSRRPHPRGRADGPAL